MNATFPDFTVDSRLEADSHFVIDLELSQVRLSNNAAFPWLILIPRRANIVEIIDLDDTDRELLFKETVLASQIMRQMFQPTKLNVANLGNIVPQLHVHVVARFDKDGAWPGPIWNSGVREDYDSAKLQERLLQVQGAFNEVYGGAGS